MSKAYVHDFFRALDRFEDREFLLYKILYDIAPTIAGIKPSSLMTFFNHKREMLILWDRYKEEICKQLQVRFYELRRKEDRVIVLFYRDEELAHCLSIWKNKAFLREQGYGD